MSMKTVLGQPSWRIASGGTEAFITEAGGHLGPVRMRLGERTVEPFSVAPWAEETIGQPEHQMLRSLRGDFFCLPFGGNETAYEGEIHPPHGDSANLDWALESLAADEIHLSMATKIRPGRLDKRVRLDGNVIYQTHTISGMSGPMPAGHHAMLKFPSEGRLSTSAFLRGRVYPGEFERPPAGGYTSLLPGATFDDLSQVPMANGGLADLSHYPARDGFEDLVQLYHPLDAPFAWNAVVVDGYVWISLKDPKVLPATVLWHSNGGRHYNAWNGRHRRVLGVEDVRAYFHYGVAESAAENPSPVPTVFHLDSAKPTEIRYVMAVAAVPEGFDIVDGVLVNGEGIKLQSRSGPTVDIDLDPNFLTAK